MHGKNVYVAFYRGKTAQVRADTAYDAQRIAAELFKARKQYEVTVVLAEKDGNQVVHTPAE